ncbi:hypothetical protein [Methylobacterium marchantiae]|uniref:Uncharacterized protein n=1 Tax=Methylobacterium marchantiae TaxID=600331 RepID=A0ABW3WSG6_9HYPH|nr:hypothetical protein AIGOOFII_0326 [Methylobacterium marchantiae]
MSAQLLSEIEAINGDVVAGKGSGPGATNLWRAGLHHRARHSSPTPALRQLASHQTLLARYLSDELPGALAQRGGRRLAGCSGKAACTSAACPVCRAFGDAWLARTCGQLLQAKPHGWVAFGGIILDEDPIEALEGYTPRRLSDEFNRSLQLLGLDHLAWHGRFAVSVQSSLATREDSITITVAAVATTGPYHDLSGRFDERPLGTLMAFRAAAAVEAGAEGIGDACRLAHHQWNVPTATQQGCTRLSQFAAPPAHNLPGDLRAIELELAVASHVATWGYRDLLLPASAARFDHLIGSDWVL